MWIKDLESQLDAALLSSVEDPQKGRIEKADLSAYFGDAATVVNAECIGKTSQGQLTAFEYLATVDGMDGANTELPMAAVLDQRGSAPVVRIYHSTWPLTHGHLLRNPIVPGQPTLKPSGIVATYMAAIDIGDVEATIATFAPNGAFREPSGGRYIYRGPEQLREHYTQLFSQGGAHLIFANIIDDGQHIALEYICDKLGPIDLPPQAGMAVYHMDNAQKIIAVHVYDDVFLPTVE